jgi:hypothetical protein
MKIFVQTLEAAMHETGMFRSLRFLSTDFWRCFEPKFLLSISLSVLLKKKQVFRNDEIENLSFLLI